MRNPQVGGSNQDYPVARTRKLDVAASVHGADQEKATAPVPVPEGRRAHPRSSRPKTREGKKGVLIYVLPEMSQQLRQLALDEDSTVQALGHEALDSLLVQRGRGA